MFAKSFYNAGYTIASLGEFVPFLKSVPKEKHPEYLIINLDQWMFNETWDKLDRSYDKSHWSDTFQKNANLSTMISVWKDIFAKKYSFQITKNENVTTIGLNACFNNTGFRNDGSMWYGGQIKKLLDHNAKANDFECKETLQRIVTGTNRFEFGNTINPKALKALDELLKYCKQQNIQLISFIPPFADKVNEALSKSNHHQYMDLVTPACLPIFKKYDDEFYDFRYLKSIDSNDTEVIDGFHGSEVTYLKMLLKMVEANSVLKNVINLAQLKSDLEKAKNKYEVYER
jgi:hypothetical protein